MKTNLILFKGGEEKGMKYIEKVNLLNFLVTKRRKRRRKRTTTKKKELKDLIKKKQAEKS